jgi:hypothetical protein
MMSTHNTLNRATEREVFPRSSRRKPAAPGTMDALNARERTLESYWPTSTPTSRPSNARAGEGLAVGEVQPGTKRRDIGSQGRACIEWMERARQLGKQVALSMAHIPEVTVEMVEEGVARGWNEILSAQSHVDKHRRLHLEEAKSVVLNALRWQRAFRRLARPTAPSVPQPAVGATGTARRTRVVPQSDPHNFNDDDCERRKVIVWNTRRWMSVDLFLRECATNKVDTSGWVKVWRTGRLGENRLEVVCRDR